jgi:hypothetical protein
VKVGAGHVPIVARVEGAHWRYSLSGNTGSHVRRQKPTPGSGIEVREIRGRGCYRAVKWNGGGCCRRGFGTGW